MFAKLSKHPNFGLDAKEGFSLSETENFNFYLVPYFVDFSGLITIHSYFITSI